MDTKELLNKLKGVPACAVGDNMLKLGFRPDKIVMNHLRPIFEMEDPIIGPAVTIKYVLSREDAKTEDVKRLMYTPIDNAEPGSVLIIAGGKPHFALFGDIMGTRCKLKGFSGVILESGAKDSISLKKIGLPTFAFGPCIVGALFGKYAKPIECNTTVLCDGVEVNPGDIIVADNDGIVVVPKDVLPKIVEMVEETERKEEEAKKQLQAGKTLSEAYPMDESKKK